MKDNQREGQIFYIGSVNLAACAKNVQVGVRN